jgi:hypothetical protein
MTRFSLGKILVIILILCVIPVVVSAQEEALGLAGNDSAKLIVNRLQDDQQPGKVKVYQDPRLTSVLRKHLEFNKTYGTSGYRILIYKGRDMTKANQAKAEFENSFSQLGLPVEIQYNEPDFSTMIGSFRTREDAFRFKKQLVVKFPQAYLVQTKITLD